MLRAFTGETFEPSRQSQGKVDKRRLIVPCRPQLIPWEPFLSTYVHLLLSLYPPSESNLFPWTSKMLPVWPYHSGIHEERLSFGLDDGGLSTESQAYRL